MILSLLVGLASIIVSILGLKCTKIGRTSEYVKEQIALAGGILFILSGTSRSVDSRFWMNDSLLIRSLVSSSGLFTLIAVSWYAGRVIQDFYDPLNGRVRSVTHSSTVMCVCVCVCVCV